MRFIMFAQILLFCYEAGNAVHDNGIVLHHNLTRLFTEEKTNLQDIFTRPESDKFKDTIKDKKTKKHLEYFGRNEHNLERKYHAYLIKNLPYTERNKAYDSGENNHIKRSHLPTDGAPKLNASDSKEKNQKTTTDVFTDSSFAGERETNSDFVHEMLTSPLPYQNTHYNRIRTLEDVEKLLNRTWEEVEQFLDSFTNEVQRRVVKNHLYFCPYTPLCNFSFGLSVGFVYEKSRCSPCSCSTDCEVTDICCPDILDFTKYTLDTRPIVSKQPECFDLSLKKEKGYNKNFLTITKCPETDETESSTHHLCMQNAEYKTFEEIVPVIDTTKNITYKNQHCAICNGAPRESLTPWLPSLTCKSFEGKPYIYGSDSELIQFVLWSESCNVQFSQPAGIDSATTCVKNIYICNQTGRWSSFDPFLFSTCLFYENLYSASLDTYRNIFCALCNGESPHNVLVSVPEAIVADNYAFSGLLNFDLRREENFGPADGRCEKGFIYDLTTDSCLELTCSNLRTLRNNSCELLYSRIHSAVYELSAELYQVGGEEELHGYFLRDVYEVAKSEVFWTIYGLLYEPHRQTYMSCSFALYNCVDGTNSKCPCASKYFVKAKFVIKQWHSVDDIVASLAKFGSLNFNISNSEKYHSFRLQAKDLGQHDYLLSDPLIKYDYCQSDAEPIHLSQQKSCPLVAFASEHYDCFEKTLKLSYPTLHITLNASDYFYSSNFSHILICSDIYMATTGKLQSRKEVISSAVLSLVCTILSLFCLTLSLVTFCLFPLLRTLPGRNTMALIASLILAQSMFLIGSFGRFERESTECKVFGALTHFSWLLAIFWMNVCTFHVFRVFMGIKILYVDSKLKTFSTYSVYVITVSALLIIINIGLSLSSSGLNDFGYGKTSCYINSKTLAGFTFGLPIGFVIVSNTFMFLFFVIKIKRAPAVQKDVKNERTDIIIFIKLSTLTGITWIFGFIYSWTDTEVFSYLFILLNASQGVFLFLSFVCNKRVFDMFKKRSFGVTSATEAYRTRLTDSKQSTSNIN